MGFVPFTVLVFATAMFISLGYLFRLVYPKDKVLFAVFMGAAIIMAVLALFATTIK